MTLLDENYTLERDSFNWILKYRSERTEIDKNTKLPKIIVSTNESYHSTINFALQKYCDSVKKDYNESVDKLIDVTERLEKMLKNFKL